MKPIKTLSISILTTVGLIIFFYFGVLIANHLGYHTLSDYIDQKSTAFINSKLFKDYPKAVFWFMLTGALLELTLSFNMISNWLVAAKNESGKILIKIGGGFLGLILALTAIAAWEANYAEVSLGWNTFLFVVRNLAAPFFLVGVLHMLREPDFNPRREYISKMVARVVYVAFICVSIYGLISEI